MNPVRRILFLILIALLAMPSVGEADRGIKRKKDGVMRHALVIGKGLGVFRYAINCVFASN